MVLPNFHTMKVIFISITLRESRTVVHPLRGHELATPRRSPRSAGRQRDQDFSSPLTRATMLSCRGVGTPALRPSAAMPPLSTSISVGRRASTSCSMLGLWSYASAMASSTAFPGGRTGTIPARSQTASASATSASTWPRRARSVQRGPIGSPVSAASGLVAELKMTFVHCGPRASASACVRSPPAPRLERPEPGVPGRVVPHYAGRHDRPGRDDAAADDPRHQFGDHLLVAEPVLHADHGGAGQGRPRPRHRGPRVQRLGGDQAEVARGQVTPVGAGADLGGEVRQPGDPQAAGPDRVHVLGPGVDGPYLDAGHTRQVRGVQAPDRAAADDGDAGHEGSNAIRAISAQTAGSPPPTPSPATTCPPSLTGSPPGTPRTGGTTSAASAATPSG